MGHRLTDAYRLDRASPDGYDDLREAFEWYVPDRLNIAEYVCDAWADGDTVAVYATDEAGRRRTFRFEDLRVASNRLANHLASRGVEPGDRVAIRLGQTPEALIAHLATWKLGGVAVALSTLLGPEGLSYRLADSDVAAGVVAADGYDAYREAAADLDVGPTLTDEPADGGVALWDAVEAESPEHSMAETTPDDDAVIYYTSGTTGEPKGVVHGHRLLLGTLPAFVVSTSNLELAPDDVYWTVPDWMWQGAFMTGVVPALCFGRPVLAYDRGSFDPDAAFRLLDEYDVSVLHLPPTAIRMLMDVPEPAATYELDSLRVVQTGGEPIGADVFEWVGSHLDVRLHPGYGQTEAHLFVGACSALFETPRDSTGRALPGHDASVVDPDTLEPVPTGETGEIALAYDGNPTCLKRYLHEPEETAATIRDGLLLTGDLGSLDEAGNLHFEARKDDVIISAGHRIGPEEIETTLAAHPAVAAAGVVGVPDDERGQVPKAFVTVASGVSPSDALREELQAFVKDRLAKHKYPRRIEFVEALPLTSSGKVDRSALADP